jgi:transcriptional regulator GlxA family with amidase domain
MRKITVAFLLFPRFQLLDLAGPCDAFGEVKVLSGSETQYEVMTIGTTRGQITSSSGVNVMPDRTIFDPCPQFDTVLVPGGLGVFDVLEDSTVLDWLVAQSRASRRIAAICNGGFALGAAGLLDGKTISTHWMDAPRMASMFPGASVEADRIFVKDGSLYTTAGVTAGIDLSLLFIEEDLGKKMALDVAKYLVVQLRRTGGQSQFSPLLQAQAEPDSVVAGIQEFLVGNLQLSHTVASIAEHFNMSARNLARVFSKGTSTTPINYLNDARIDAARRYLEGTDLAIKTIASKCGFENSERLRRLFSQRIGMGPLDYKQRFRSSDVPTRKRPAKASFP